MSGTTYKYLAADFETTVYLGQVRTDVWAAACCELYSDSCFLCNTIDKFFCHLYTLKSNMTVYFHNLKFDGAFILDYLLNNGYKLAVYIDANASVVFKKKKNLQSREIITQISDRGLYYAIIIKKNKQIIEFRDSLKLIPFSLKEIAKAFNTQHKKLDMNYIGKREPGMNISSEERAYIINDVLVLKEVLEIMFDKGHKKLTIGGCCMSEFKKSVKINSAYDFDERYPNLYHKKIAGEEITQAEFVRRSYRGGWCYLKPELAGKQVFNGETYDVNSLYPSVMHSESGNYYPVGVGYYSTGLPPEWVINDITKVYFLKFTCQFFLKDGYLPFVQIKNNLLYQPTLNLTSSDIVVDGERRPNTVTLYMTNFEFDLFKKHYHVYHFNVESSIWFYTDIGMFDDYINYYKSIKEESTGALRTLAKLFLNNLYGKFASSIVSSFKWPIIEDGKLKMINQEEYDKEPGYIPIGACVTAYARRFTITAAQKNFNTFIYADTDSIHKFTGKTAGILEHSTAFLHWKKECTWSRAIFTRQKTYIEETSPGVHDIKCAGMGEVCKKLIQGRITLDRDILDTIKDFNDRKDFKDFALTADGEIKPFDYEDFNPGLVVPGKLGYRLYPGGALLVDTTYKMS